MSEDDYRRLTLRKLAWLMRRHKETGRDWDQRFAIAVRWLIAPNMKKGASLTSEQIYPSLKSEQQLIIDPTKSFESTRALIGAH